MNLARPRLWFVELVTNHKAWAQNTAESLRAVHHCEP